MALISEFEERQSDVTQVHGKVTCGYRWFDVGADRYMVLETFGSVGRQIPGKVSQSIQLDRAAASVLKALLERGFPGI